MEVWPLAAEDLTVEEGAFLDIAVSFLQVSSLSNLIGGSTEVNTENVVRQTCLLAGNK
jgi:hypothetical protein